MGGQQRLIRVTGVLHAAIGMMHEASAWSAMDQRHPQRRGRQITMQRGAERPPDDTPRKENDDDGEVVPAFAMSLTTDTGHGRLPRIVRDQGVH
jgi:hypothetical protein